MRTVESPGSGAQANGNVFAEGAAALHIDGTGMVVGVDPLDGTPGRPNRIAPIALRELLHAKSVASALEDVRQVLATGSARFVSWNVAQNGASRLYAGWLYPEDGEVVGVLRCFESPA
ncbi:MAG: hypothetical protein P8Z36_14365 [Gemmatimonadota bacterium]|jgi:hypothetical protein